MKKILLASTNKNKLREFKQILEPLGFEVESLSDNDLDDVREDGRTFEENALIKARYYHKKKNCDVIAEDSGISIKYLNNMPGIHSARFLSDMSYPLKCETILNIMKDVKDREAHYTSAIAFIHNDVEYTFIGEWYGEIATYQNGTNGFGYDPIFYLKNYKATSAEVDSEVKNALSHRAKSIASLLEFLNNEKA